MEGRHIVYERCCTHNWTERVVGGRTEESERLRERWETECVQSQFLQGQGNALRRGIATHIMLIPSHSTLDFM
jgi:hypothetical protein